MSGASVVCPLEVSLEGRVALVTGGSSRLGESVCRVLSSLGASVAIAFNTNEERAKSLSDELDGSGTKCVALQTDLSSEADARALVRSTERALASPTILVTIAGAKDRHPALSVGEHTVRELVAVNLESVMYLAKACLRSMILTGWGRIVAVGSRAGLTGHPGQAAYAASKGGLGAWASSLAGEVGGRGVTVNVVAPGLVEQSEPGLYSAEENARAAERIAVRRPARVLEVAQVIAFLTTEAASYVTGATWPVDGGARY